MELMECGHVANAREVKPDGTSIAYCVICGCTKVSAKNIDRVSENKQAKCIYCGDLVVSDHQLAFFRSIPEQQYDSYYCGCRGWD